MAARLTSWLTLAACGLLVFSLTDVWWVIEDWERSEARTARGSSTLVIVVVGMALVAAAAVVARASGTDATGRRSD